MSIVTGMTAAKMQEIANASIVSGLVNPAGKLILSTKGGVLVDAGSVVDPIQLGAVDQYWRGDRTWQSLNKSAVGLGNVDNTSDANKPVPASVTTLVGNIAKGCVFSTKVATNTGAITTLTVVNSIATFTFKAGRKYRVVWDTDWFGTAADASGAFTIATAPVLDSAQLTTGITPIGTRNAQAPVINVTAPAYTVAYFDPTIDTTVQLKFLAAIDGSAGSLVVQGNRAGAPSQYRVYDDGAQF